MHTDVVVIGGGIAGVSAGAALAQRGLRVVLLEKEQTLAHHTTGRSAAISALGYGQETFRPLSARSRPLLEELAEEAEHPLSTPRSILFVGEPGDEDVVAELEVSLERVSRVTPAEAVAEAPALVESAICGGVLDCDGLDLDVHGIHQGYVKRLRRHGGEITTYDEALELRPAPHGWTVTTSTGTHESGFVVNAAGAWGDVVTQRAGLRPLRLEPRRRTAFTVAVPDEMEPRRWPHTVSAAQRWYFKPEGDGVMCSLADETLSDPCDAKPEEADIALAIERINAVTTLAIRSVRRGWAGLRTFSPDRGMVCGFDPDAEDFVHVVGQGGTGIQTAPAVAEVVAKLITSEPLDATELALSPARFR